MGNRGRGSGSGAGGSGGGGPQMNFSMMAPMTPVVKSLIIANVAIWLVLQLIISMVAERFFHIDLNITYLFGLVPNNVIFKFFVWEPFTYMFLHSTNPFHILFNMLLLWWLGGELEQRWGSKFFLLYYIVTGIGAAVLYVAAVALHGWVFGSLTPAWTIPVVGASGAIFGLMLAYGIIFGERVVYFMMLFPMRAKYFVMILGAVEVVTLLNNGIGGGDVANLAHVGGLISGFIFLRVYTAFQQRKWRNGGKDGKARGRGLKLVVNNDNKKDDKGGGGGGPKYWN
jgi:membrane associated rhomboid family serine protease